MAVLSGTPIPAKHVLSCQSLPLAEVTAATSISGVPGTLLSFEGLRLVCPGFIEPCLGKGMSVGGSDRRISRQVQRLSSLTCLQGTACHTCL